MQRVTTIGLDIAKSVFQVHGVDAEGKVVVRRQLKRRYVLAFFQKLPPCLVGIEACASSHHWSRALQELGHTVRLMPASYVKPYVKRQKNDAADAEAICEAVGSGSCRSNTRVGAKTSLVVSANRAIAICAACSWPERSPSSAMPRSTEPGIGLGSRRCWRGPSRDRRVQGAAAPLPPA